ncbi:DUF2254 family protein [Kitasatospora sp. NPDC050467]|uniref:DUF2254 family protein n=1 Tax=Kitasatospora sp. NPDC050467 TaxID=3364053 RepID=UPI0037B74CEE
MLVPSLILIAILVLVVRPLIAFAAARGSDLTTGEWGFIGWMAPRGIVAASTASAFAATLVEKGLPGAAKILPITFLVTVGTVVLYALTAAPVARRLKVVRPSRTRPLLVGGEPWVIGLGKALQSAGLDVLMWAGLDEERDRITMAGIELAHGEMLATATNPRARLEGVTAVFLLTDDDDFNALASVVVKDNVEGPVYRVGPPRDSHGVVAPYTGGDILFGHALVRHRLAARYEQGARFHLQPGSPARPPGPRPPLRHQHRRPPRPGHRGPGDHAAAGRDRRPAGPRMMSWAARFRLRQYAKASLWIVPLAGLVLGVALAEAATAVDGASWLPKTWDYSASTASSVLSSVVGSMIALLGFVVTIGVLVIQQATGTLSPRYMRLWYRDRLQKAVLATFTGTFAFAYTLLRSIETDSVPNLGVTLAGIAVSASLLLLLIYLNRFTHNLRPVAIADIVGRLGERVLDRAAAGIRSSTARDPAPRPGSPAGRIRSERGGVIQAINAPGLVALAARHDCVLVLAASVGDFVPPGATVVEIHGGAPAPDPHRVTGLLALGAERTVEQDPAFALRILVDIAIRALSPAVNDPTTAVQVLNHIEMFLYAVGRVGLRSSYVLADDHGRPRLVLPGRPWEDYLELAVTEIRDYGATSVRVCRRLRALLEGLLAALPQECRPALRLELSLLDLAVDQAFGEGPRRADARTPDPQGIGGGRHPGGAPPDTPAPGGPGR